MDGPPWLVAMLAVLTDTSFGGVLGTLLLLYGIGMLFQSSWGSC
ncbi:hypothetical protein [Saccharomonospora azurea]|nr:hypothetical protein [Saccharomonospora azurea]